MSDEKKIDMSAVFVGFTLISAVFNDREGSKIGRFLGGMYDHEIGIAMFFREHNRLPESVEELNTDKTGLERMKNMYRVAVSNAIEAEALKEREELQKRFKEKEEALKKTFKEMHSKAPEGTVRELAAKFNKSISEIRRMKAEGRLGELSQQ